MDSLLYLTGRRLTAAQFEYDDTTHHTAAPPAGLATGVRRTRVRLAQRLHRATSRPAPAL